MDERQLRTADEKDYLDSATKNYFTHRAGARKAVKVRLHRRVRHNVKTAIRAGREI